METKFYSLKFPDGSFYKGYFSKETNEMFSNFGLLKKNSEYYLTYVDNFLYKNMRKYI
jgi:hypothetical protein